MIKRVAFGINVCAFLAFFVLLSVELFCPQQLLRVGLEGEKGKILLLQIVSLMLLLGGFSSTMGLWGRRLALGASFVVLSESLLIGLLLPGLR